MNQFLTIIVLFLLLLASCTNNEQGHTHDAVVITKTRQGEVDTSKKSIPAYVQNKIGAARVRIHYHSPAVRGRIIWGGLVPYDAVWVTGAHNATNIESDMDFIIDGKRIAAGKYAFFTIPGREEWTAIINKNWDQHLADEYKQEDDLVRIKIKPAQLDYNQERLMYDINQWSQKEGDIIVMWERLKLVIPVRIGD
jgi:hypothetical protein